MEAKIRDLRGQADNLCREIRSLICSIPESKAVAEGDSGFDANRAFHEYVHSLTAALSDQTPQHQTIDYDEHLILRQKQMIDEITRQITHESALFSERIDDIKREFEETVNDITLEYSQRRQDSEALHELAMSDLMTEILRSKASFDMQIEEMKDAIISEKEELAIRIQKDKAQFAEWKAEIEKHLRNMEDRNTEDERYVNSLLEDRERALQTTSESFESEEPESRLHELELEKSELEAKLDRVKSELQPRINDLEEKLKIAWKESEEELEPLLAEKRQELELDIRTAVDKARAEAKVLREKLVKAQENREAESREWREKLSDLREQLDVRDSENAKKLEMAKQEAKAKLQEKDAELNKARAANSKQIENMEAQFNAKIKEQRAAVEQEVLRVEKQLQQTRAQLEQRKKRRELDRKVPEPENLIVKPKAGSGSPRRRKELEGEDPFGDMRTNFSISESESKAMYDEVLKRKNQHGSEIRAQKTKLRAAMKQFEQEKQEFEAWMAMMDEKIKSFQLVKESYEPSERELDLMNKVALQKNTILQLVEDVDRRRTDDVKLEKMHEKRRQTIADIEKVKQDLQDSLAEKLNAVSAEMSQKLADERKRNQEMLLEAAKKLDGALSELLKAKEASETFVMEDYRKWKELRTEIGETTSTICNRVSQRASVAQMAHLNGMAVLPPLRS